MTKTLLQRLTLLLAGWFLILPVSAGTPQSFDVFCYHDVRDDVQDDVDIDPIATSTARLVQHLAWLREHGFTPVSVDAILNAHAGGKPLPAKAVLLTFDDGYESFYTRVYPVLKEFHYPAVLALVGSWLAVPEGGTVSYGDEKRPRSQFLTLDQIREMHDSGLIEMASHSYDLHHGVQGNPQGNQQPAATTWIYDPTTSKYEGDVAYRARIRADLERNSKYIAGITGQRPRVIVWPYGAYTQVGMEIAQSLGMTIGLTLRDGIANSASVDAIPRHLMEGNTTLSNLVWALQRNPDDTPLRVAQVDLDYLYDSNAAQMNRNFDVLLERIKSLQINTVYLQAFADPDGDGTASALYFPNRHLPMRADLFNRVAWQLRTRGGVQVYAWMPLLAFDIDGKPAPNELRVQGEAGDRSAVSDYRRLSPFNPQARRVIREIYEDLAAHANFAGILFHDDAAMSDHEDINPAALKVYHEQWHLPESPAAIRADPAKLERWTQLKTQYLIDFSHELTQTVQRMRPEIHSARNLYASVIMDPVSEQWFAQNPQVFAQGYDYVALMAMPLMEKAANPTDWLQTLVRKLPRAMRAKTVFELQSRDWQANKALPTSTLVEQMQMLANAGVRNFGYYPDDFVGGNPDLSLVFPALSLSTYPYRPKGTKELSSLYSGERIP